MSSQTDLDQGGTFRELVRIYMGPSVGWVMGPARTVLPVTTTGTTTAIVGTTLIMVNVANTATVQLPSALSSRIPAGAMPGTYVAALVTIVDISGNANDTTRKITILPYGSETIMGMASLEITVPYGGYTLRPSLTSPGIWTQASG